MKTRDVSETYPGVTNALKKTKEQVENIKLNDAIVTRFFNQFGFDFSPLFPEQFYIIPTDVFIKFPNTNEYTFGRAIPFYGAVIINNEVTKNPLWFASVIRHEIIHMRGVMLYRKYLREGFGVGKKMKGLNEMFVEFTTNALNREFLNRSAFPEERIKYEENIDELVHNEKRLKKFLGTDVYSHLSFWPKSEVDQVAALFIEYFDDSGDPVMSGYHHLVDFFLYFMEEMGKNLNMSVKSDIYPTFVKTYLTGNLLPLGRMIEKTFGKGAFHLLSTMTPQDEWNIESFYAKIKRNQKK